MGKVLACILVVFASSGCTVAYRNVYLHPEVVRGQLEDSAGYGVKFRDVNCGYLKLSGFLIPLVPSTLTNKCGRISVSVGSRDRTCPLMFGEDSLLENREGVCIYSKVPAEDLEITLFRGEDSVVARYHRVVKWEYLLYETY